MREPCSQGGGASGRDPAALAPGAMVTTRLLIRKRGRDTALRPLELEKPFVRVLGYHFEHAFFMRSFPDTALVFGE